MNPSNGLGLARNAYDTIFESAESLECIETLQLCRSNPVQNSRHFSVKIKGVVTQCVNKITESTL